MFELGNKWAIFDQRKASLSVDSSLYPQLKSLEQVARSSPSDQDLGILLVALCAAQLLSAPEALKNIRKSVNDLYKLAEEVGVKKDTIDKNIRQELEAVVKGDKESKDKEKDDKDKETKQAKKGDGPEADEKEMEKPKSVSV